MVAIRRTALVLGLVMGTGASAGAAATVDRTAPRPTQDWSSIGFNNHNTAHDPTERTLTSRSVHTLRPVVHRSIPKMGGPLVIAHHRLFGVCGGHQIHVGICAWSTATLHRLWRTRVVGTEMDLAAAAHTLVVHAEASTRYLAFHQASGARSWRVNEPDPTYTVGLPPAVATARTLTYFDNDGRIVRRSMRTGRQLSRIAAKHLPATAADNALLWELAGAIVTHHTVYTAAPDDLIAAAPLTCGHRQVCPPAWTAHAGPDAHLIYADHRIFASYSVRYTGRTDIGAYNARTGHREFTLRSDIVGELAEGDVEYLEAARDLVFFSDRSGYLRAWQATGCGHPRCKPIWMSQPIRGGIETPRFAETNGRLFTQGAYVYTTANIRHSRYGRPAAARHIKVDFDPRMCDTNITWKRPARTGRLPLTGSTVTLADGKVTYGDPVSGNFYGLPAGSYHAKIAVNNAWGRGPTASTTFTVPACSN